MKNSILVFIALILTSIISNAQTDVQRTKLKMVENGALNKNKTGFIFVISPESESDEMTVLLFDPGNKQIRLLTGDYTDSISIFHTDILIMKYSYNILSVKGWCGFESTNDNGMKSIVGLPNSRIEISKLKNGFNFAGKTWYPEIENNSFIICYENEIIGVNVRVQ